MADPQDVKFAFVSDRKQTGLSASPDFYISDYSFSDLAEKLFAFSGIVLQLHRKSKEAGFLPYLRGHKQLYLKPLYLTSSLDPSLDVLADGIISDYENAFVYAEPILQKCNSLSYDLQTVADSPVFRVMLYYYTRNAEIIPLKDWQSPTLYTFPLVEILSGLSENVDQWLESQTRRQIFERGKLVDRVRCCPQCRLANPNYIDVCSNCRSIHIQQDTFLHCFACGAVQPEADFHSASGMLVCPKCNERLRHIGTDYDRPLENHTCSDCQSSFSDPLIIAVCPRCETTSETEDLEVKRFAQYTLTEKAVIAAQTGYFSEPISLIDDLQNVSFQHFNFLLSWFFSMSQRYKDEKFTIFAIRLANLDELETSMGTVRLFELMEEYVKRVRASLRVTDFSSRGKDNDLWFILPKTDVSQREAVLKRIMDFGEESKNDTKEIHLDMQMVALTIPTQIDEHYSPDKIISVLNDELDSN